MDALLQEHKTKANAKNSARDIVQQQPQQQTLTARYKRTSDTSNTTITNKKKRNIHTLRQQ